MNSYNTGVKDCNGYDLYLGDTVILLDRGKHVKEASWNPRYEIIRDAPKYKLKHIGGGDDVEYAHWLFDEDNYNKQLVLCDAGPYRNIDDVLEDVLEVIKKSELDKIFEERDFNHERADDLAEAISRMTNRAIGEHSSINDPWQNALEYAEQYVQEVESSRRGRYNKQLIEAYRTCPEVLQLQFLAGEDVWVNCEPEEVEDRLDIVCRIVTKSSMEY